MNKELRTFNYWCSGSHDTCTYCNSTGMLQIEADVEVEDNNNKMPSETFLCPSNEEHLELKLMGQSVPKRQFIKLNNAQIKSDRTARSRQHFKDEVFNTLSMEDKRIHARKDPELAKRLK